MEREKSLKLNPVCCGFINSRFSWHVEGGGDNAVTAVFPFDRPSRIEFITELTAFYEVCWVGTKRWVTASGPKWLSCLVSFFFRYLLTVYAPFISKEPTHSTVALFVALLMIMGWKGATFVRQVGIINEQKRHLSQHEVFDIKQNDLSVAVCWRRGIRVWGPLATS